MKILFICCAGMSSSLVVKRLEDYIKQLNASNDKKINLSIEAIPLDKFKDFNSDYSLILLAPQIAYKLKDFKSLVSNKNEIIPVGVVKGLDYGLLKVDNILSSALQLLSENS
ncbi:MAG: PTS sugar transporter subunit IIB [Sarcina sp.]